MSEKTLKPIGSNILLIPYVAKELASGIIIPQSSQEQQVKTMCMVSAVGPDVVNDGIVEGAMVLIPRHTGAKVPFEGDEYYLLKEEEILAIVEGVE